MDNGGGRFLLEVALALLICTTSVAAALLSPSSSGFGGQTRSQNYDALLDALYTNGNVTTTVGSNLWVPWFSTSSACGITNLQSGGNCNSGESIDFTHNCMVTDEFSQVGVLLAMGDDQSRMTQFHNTVNAIKSTHGQLPSWRVYRSGSSIEACRSGINSNCDTASDADARIIIALFTAANNSLFADSAQKQLYRELAINLSRDFLAYEVDQTCRPSDLGHGQICYWMAAGYGAKSGGLGSTDYGYTGYYADGIIAMLQACAQTGNSTYCAVAGNFTLNYLQAANYTGASFTAPPGRSFKWTNLATRPTASCTNTCGPDKWDSADAPRAFGMCQALAYADLVGVTLPMLGEYCADWVAEHFGSSTSVPIQYSPNGDAAASSQSGYLAQGLQALAQGGANTAQFATTLDSALSHYATSTQTWDYTACFGVYNQAFAVRALGFGIGRDEVSFPTFIALNDSGSPANDSQNSTPNATQDISFSTTTPASATPAIDEPENRTFSYTLSNPDSLSTTTVWRLNGITQAASGTTYQFLGNYSADGTYTVNVTVVSSQNTISTAWTLTVGNTTPLVVNGTPDPEPEGEANLTASAGGGGGGGIPAGEEQLTPVIEEPSAISAALASLRSVVASYFLGESQMTSVDLVRVLRGYYRDGEGAL